MEQLKPCPFCGGKVEMVTDEMPISGNGKHTIECCVYMEEYFILDHHRPNKRVSKKAAENALIKNWNKRHGAGE